MPCRAQWGLQGITKMNVDQPGTGASRFWLINWKILKWTIFMEPSTKYRLRKIRKIKPRPRLPYVNLKLRRLIRDEGEISNNREWRQNLILKSTKTMYFLFAWAVILQVNVPNNIHRPVLDRACMICLHSFTEISLSYLMRTCLLYIYLFKAP